MPTDSGAEQRGGQPQTPERVGVVLGHSLSRSQENVHGSHKDIEMGLLGRVPPVPRILGDRIRQPAFGASSLSENLPWQEAAR